MILWLKFVKKMKPEFSPDDLVNFINVSYIVLSTADREPGIKDLATPIAPLSINDIASGCVMSRLVM